MATATATEAMATAEDTTEDTMGRGLPSPLLRLSQVLMLSQRLMLTPTTDTVDMATAVATTVVTAEDTTEDTMGRGLPSLLLQLNQVLTPSQRLPLTPTMDTAVAME